MSLSLKIERPIMTQLTNQEIFDKALFGIRAQNYQRSVYDYSCRYRGENGTKCAVGHCIDDETAAVWDKLTDTTISGIAVNVKIRESFEKFFNLEQIKFLMQLQRATRCEEVGYNLSKQS